MHHEKPVTQTADKLLPSSTRPGQHGPDLADSCWCSIGKTISQMLSTKWTWRVHLLLMRDLLKAASGSFRLWILKSSSGFQAPILFTLAASACASHSTHSSPHSPKNTCLWIEQCKQKSSLSQHPVLDDGYTFSCCLRDLVSDESCQHAIGDFSGERGAGGELECLHLWIAWAPRSCLSEATAAIRSAGSKQSTPTRL